MSPLEVEDLSFSYGGSRVLWDVCLRAREGSILCLMGRNGVGKTTLLKNIVGLLEPQKGAIRLFGTDLTRKRPSARARQGMGYVPQGREILPYLTVEENLLLPLLSLKERVEKRAAMDRVLEIFPALKNLLRRKGGVLSGGQQQQLAIARALIIEPRVLILDEPTEGIQPSIVQEIGEVLLRLKQQSLAILLVEQCVSFARRVADHFCLMEKGRIVAGGEMPELSDELVRKYLSV